MPEMLAPDPLTTISTIEPTRKRARLNITKNTKGYSYDSTGEVEWSAGDGMAELATLTADLDTLARCEIADRMYLDAHPEAGRITRSGEDSMVFTSQRAHSLAEALARSGVDLSVSSDRGEA